MTPHRLDRAQLRVLGCLIEKQRTTPDAYPLSLNSLRLACNQATNREPVLELDEGEVREAVQRLSQIGWVRLASGPGSRAAKYRQLFEEALALDSAETVLLGLLFLRGPQTVAELKARSERLHSFASNDDVAEALQRLEARELAQLQPRRPGQREDRWAHLFAEDSDGDEHVAIDAAPASLEHRLARIEERLAEVERTLGLA